MYIKEEEMRAVETRSTTLRVFANLGEEGRIESS